MGDLWTVAAVLAGFQLAAVGFRINREIYMEERYETTWLTLADGFVGLSLLVLVFGVFAAPIFGTADVNLAERLLGLSLVLFVSAGFVLVGHYNLYGTWGRNGPRGQVTKQECAAVAFTLLMLGGYGVWWALS